MDSIDLNKFNDNYRRNSCQTESIYRPDFYRSRSMSCDNKDMNGSNERKVHIRLNRRKSVGVDMKFGTRSPGADSSPRAEINNKNELIITIPVLIEENGNELNDCQLNKDVMNDKTDFPCGEPQMQSSWTVLKQMLIPFLIAGIGSVGAGIILNDVQHSPAFDAIPQLVIMIPAFLGLTGNIETTLASRLSTHANLGTLDDISRLKTMIAGNSAVILCQASTVGLFAAFASLAMYYMKTQTFNALSIEKVILLLCASSVCTSVVANALLATVITTVIIISRKFNINPDNISTPVAASMGDVCTISMLAIISNFFYENASNGHEWLSAVALTVPLLSAPVMAYIARNNRYTHSVILTGWTPILGAVILEQPGGLVMESAFNKFNVMSTFQPLVNGIGSNLVGIQTSRLSTYLHQTVPKGQLPKSNPSACVQPMSTFIGNDVHSRMARLLLAITVPSHLFYLIVIRFWRNNFSFTAPFLLCYLVAVVAQVAILLYLAYVSVLWAWKRRINPDNSAIPFTSALADVLGNCLMAGAFTFLNSIDDMNAHIDLEPIGASNTTLGALIDVMNTTTNTSNYFYL